MKLSLELLKKIWPGYQPDPAGRLLLLTGAEYARLAKRIADLTIAGDELAKRAAEVLTKVPVLLGTSFRRSLETNKPLLLYSNSFN